MSINLSTAAPKGRSAWPCGADLANGRSASHIRQMSEQLYNTRILRLAASIPHQTRLDAPAGSAACVSPVCGSRVTVDLDIGAQGHVARFGQEVRACALGQASASLLGARIIGMALQDVRSGRQAVADFLAQKADLPKAWEDYALFGPAQSHKARHPSILLAFDAVLAAARAAGHTPD